MAQDGAHDTVLFSLYDSGLHVGEPYHHRRRDPAVVPLLYAAGLWPRVLSGVGMLFILYIDTLEAARKHGWGYGLWWSKEVLVWLTVVLCMLRGVPVIFEGARLFEGTATATPQPRC